MIEDQLQVAIYERLTTLNICDGRIYDRVPENADFPYVTIGDEDVLDDGNDCLVEWDVAATIHIWSRPSSGSKREVKQIMGKVQRGLCDPTLPVTGYAISLALLQQARAFRDPDGLTEHGVLTIQFTLYPQ